MTINHNIMTQHELNTLLEAARLVLAIAERADKVDRMKQVQLKMGAMAVTGQKETGAYRKLRAEYEELRWANSIQPLEQKAQQLAPKLKKYKL